MPGCVRGISGRLSWVHGAGAGHTGGAPNARAGHLLTSPFSRAAGAEGVSAPRHRLETTTPSYIPLPELRLPGHPFPLSWASSSSELPQGPQVLWDLEVSPVLAHPDPLSLVPDAPNARLGRTPGAASSPPCIPQGVLPLCRGLGVSLFAVAVETPRAGWSVVWPAGLTGGWRWSGFLRAPVVSVWTFDSFPEQQPWLRPVGAGRGGHGGDGPRKGEGKLGHCPGPWGACPLGGWGRGGCWVVPPREGLGLPCP